MSLDQLFQQAVALIGAGDVPALERLLTDHPELARERLAAPGSWLRDKISAQKSNRAMSRKPKPTSPIQKRTVRGVAPGRKRGTSQSSAAPVRTLRKNPGTAG